MAHKARLSFPALFLLPVAGVVTFGIALTAASNASAAQAPLDLGSASSFAVLAGSTVTNTGPSVVSGDLGVSPGSAVTGFRPPPTEPGLVIDGSIHAADSVANLAQSDETTAYTDAAGRSPVTNVPVELGGSTLVGGVYHSATLGLTGTLTLTGDASSVWIFQANKTLITSTASRIVLTGGASACNVYWQIGSSATLGTGSAFTGTLLAHTAITANTGATVQGRLFAQTAAVTLDSNTITRPACTTPTPPTSSAPASTPPTSASPTTGTASPTASSASPTSGRGTHSASGATSGSGTAAAPGGKPRKAPSSAHSTTTSHRHRSGTATTTAATARTSTGVTTGLTTTELSHTGSNLTSPLIGGLLAVLLGGGVLFLARRRSPHARHRN